MKPSRITVPPPITKQTSASLWEPVRLLLAALGGLLVVAIIASFLDKGAYEEGQFGTPWVTFLKGQMGFSELSKMPWFWGMLVGFVLGAVPGYFAGYLISSEIPQSHRPKVNQLALGAALFLIPVLNFIPARSAGLIWDDDQEVTASDRTNVLGALADDVDIEPAAREPARELFLHVVSQFEAVGVLPLLHLVRFAFFDQNVELLVDRYSRTFGRFCAPCTRRVVTSRSEEQERCASQSKGCGPKGHKHLIV